MRVEVHNRCSDFDSYRAARVKSLFNAESGCNFDLSADLEIDDGDWSIGVVVGPSGSGKTSIGKRIFGGSSRIYTGEGEWPEDLPIVDAIAPDGSFDAVTAALAAVGLGDVPAWLRPYPVLSNGEKFRADLAKIVCEAGESSTVVVDEFTSVVDRQIARFGALAFQKAWRRDLFPMGLRLIERVLTDLERGEMVRLAQDEACATYEPSVEIPRLRRPDLPELGDGREDLWNDFTLRTR